MGLFTFKDFKDLATDPDVLEAVTGAYGAYEDRKAQREYADDVLAAGEAAAEAAEFKPYGVTTGFGTGYIDPETQTAGYELDPVMQAYRDSLMMLGSEAQPTTTNVDTATQTYYDQMQSLMAPQRAQQMANMRQDVFGSGRLGMRIAGEAAGAGADAGMVNPDFFGMNAANALQDQQMAFAARDKAMADLDAAIARSGGLMNTAFGVEKLGQEAMTLGADMGQAALSGGIAGADALLSSGTDAAKANLAASRAYPDFLSGAVNQFQ